MLETHSQMLFTEGLCFFFPSPAPTIAIHNPMMPMMDDFTAQYMTQAMHHNAPNQLLLPPPPYTHRPASPHSDTPYSSPTSSPLHSPYLSPVPSPGASPCPSPTPQLRAPSAPTCKFPPLPYNSPGNSCAPFKNIGYFHCVCKRLLFRI